MERDIVSPSPLARGGPLLALFLATFLGGTRAKALEGSPRGVRLTISNELPYERRAEPITCGVPLRHGFVEKPEQLALLGPGGKAIPCQAVVTGAYKDGTPRWVLLDFQVDLSASSRAVYRLVKRAPSPLATALSYRRNGDWAEIQTGAARFRINVKKFGFLESVNVGGVELTAGTAGGAFLEEQGLSQPHGGHLVTRAEFEDAGPMRVVLAVHGQFRPGTRLPLANFTCRMHFYNMRSEVRTFFTLHNPAAHAHPGNTWDLGAGGSVLMEDLSLVLPLARAEPWTSRVGVEAANRPVPSATKLYQDSSGGPQWNSVNHIDMHHKVPTSFRGYRIQRGKRQVGSGYRADGWLHARSHGCGVAVAVREFWQNFPKALEFNTGQLRIGLWPGEFQGVHELLGGEQKTHEILFVFHDRETTDEVIERRMSAFHHPLYAMPESEWIQATGAFWPTAPIDREKHALLEQTCDAFVRPRGNRKDSVFTKWDQIDEYGWRHFGDTFADNESSPAEMVRDHPRHHFGRQPISHFGNEYDVNYGVMLQALRRGDPKWMWLADVMCRHHADICIYHTDADRAKAYAHGPFTHTTHDTAAFRSTHRMYPTETGKYGLRYASGGPNAGHCYVASLAQHYYLTGDRNSREAFLEVADWCLNSPWYTQRKTHMGDRRGIGNLLMTHVYAYQLTANRKYYEAATEMLSLVEEPFEGLGATLFVKAAGRFLDLKAEREEFDADHRKARDTMLKFGDLYLTLSDAKPKRYLEQTCFYAEVLFTCYLYAPRDHPNRERYYTKGKALMDGARHRWSATYCPTKSFIMCFGNTGAFLKAEQVRQGG